MNISHIPTSQLREAAAAWRGADVVRTMFGRRVLNADLYDKIDDMINEIDRLRTIAGRAALANGDEG